MIIVGRTSASSAGIGYEIYSLVQILDSVFLNNIEIDTKLIKDEKYELIYNETLDKFIAEEVRNAN